MAEESSSSNKTEAPQAVMSHVRHASAYLDHNEPVFVRCGKRCFRVTRAWPDTAMAPLGRGLYLEIDERDLPA